MRLLMQFRTEPIQCVLLVLLCAWPLWNAYSASVERLAEIRSAVGSVEQSRALRRSLVQNIPVGARVFLFDEWLRAHISDSLFDHRHFVAGRLPEWGGMTYADLVQQGFDFVCIGNYDPLHPKQRPVFLGELTGRHMQPEFVLPQVSQFFPPFSFFRIQSRDEESFNLGLYFREPSAGDYAGVRGIVPPAPAPSNDRTTQSLLLKARLYNGPPWFAGYIRWEVLLNGAPIWHGRDTTGTVYVSLSLPIRARPGSEILIRTLRTAFRPDATVGWGGPRSHLKMDGLRLLAASTGKPLAIRWSYAGQNGGPGPALYAMRRDWLHNANPIALLDTGFEGPQPLVEAWRPYQIIEPGASRLFPKQDACRRMARVERAIGLGQDGSNALRLVAEYPAKKSTTLGIMQPIAYPACQHVRTLRVHYRPDGEANNRGEVRLKLIATALSLSGVYIDRATIGTRLVGAYDQWDTLELDLGNIWKRKHTRIDLIDFLEVAIEATGGRGAVFNCLIDNVEVE
jgi:hypothetical protein